jgi:membrane protein DedA with SNARE-associated domain
MGLEQLYRYLGVFFSLVGSGFGLPIPEEIPVITAGGMAANDETGCYWSIMLATCMVGIVLSDVILYWIGRRYGTRLMESQWLKRKLLSPEKRQQIEANYQEYGIRILLFSRLLPGIRTPIFMMAGVLKMPFKRFLVADAIYVIPGVNFFFWMGYWFTDRFLGAINSLNKHRDMVIVAVLAAAGGYFLYTFIRRKVSTGGAPTIPVIGTKVGHLAHDAHVKSSTEIPIYVPAGLKSASNEKVLAEVVDQAKIG